MQGFTLRIVEVISRIDDRQLEDGSLRKLDRLLHDQPTLFDSGL